MNENIINPNINEIMETIKFSEFDAKLKSKLKIQEILKQVKQVMTYNDEELNNLEYELAIKFDKRKYCQ